MLCLPLPERMQQKRLPSEGRTGEGFQVFSLSYYYVSVPKFILVVLWVVLLIFHPTSVLVLIPMFSSFL